MIPSSETPAQHAPSWSWVPLSDAQAWTLKWAQTWAKTLNNQTGFYGYKGVYGALDGLANAYSLSKFYFDMMYSASSQAEAFDAMHNWMVRPEGFAIVILDSAILMGFAAMGNVYKEDDPEPLKRQIYAAWKIFREVSQASKNALKGVRTSWLTAGLFITQDIHRLILPSGIVLGGAYALSRYLFLGINKQRDDMIATNTKLLKSIQTYGTVHRITQPLNHDDDNTKYHNSYVLKQSQTGGPSQLFFINKDGEISDEVPETNVGDLENELKDQPSKQLSIFQWNELISPDLVQAHYKAFSDNVSKEGTINVQSDWVLTKSLWLKTYNGLIDSLYLLLGVVTLAPLSGLALPLAALCSLMYCVLCIATRVYEEQELQHQLSMTVKHIHLACAGKDLEAQLADLNK